MRPVLALALLASALLAATQTILPSSPAYLEAYAQNLTLGHQGKLTIKVCNPSSIPVYYVTVTMSSKNALINPSQLSAGLLKPGKCSVSTVWVVPLQREVTVNYVINSMFYLGGAKNVARSEGSFALVAKAPALAAQPLEVTSAGGRANFTVTNEGDAPFKGVLTITKPFVAKLRLEVPPGASVTKSISVPPMNPGNYKIEYVAQYGLAKIKGSAPLTVTPSPEVSLTVGKKIRICFPRKVLALVTITAKGATPYPAQKVVEVKGCKELSYELLSPRLPTSVLVKVKIGMLTLNATALASDCTLELNTTTLWSGYDNVLSLRSSCPLPLVGNLTLTPSTGSVLPSSLPQGGGTFVWSLPSSASSAELKVNVFGLSHTFKFNVIPFQPSLTVNVEPTAVMQGSIFDAKVCITNTWVKDLKNVQVSVELSNWTSSATFEKIPSGGEACLSGKAAAPWNATEIRVKVKVLVSNVGKEYTKSITVVKSPYTASPAILTNVKSLGVGYAEADLKVKNLGKGYAKGATLTLSSEHLLYPTSVYLGDLPPGGEKVVKVKFFVPKGTKEVKLKAVLSFCSGPKGGTCLPKVYSKTFVFPVSQYVPPQISFVLNTNSVPSGKKVPITIKLVNTGGDAAKNVVVVLSSSDVKLFNTYFNVPSVAPGKSAQLKVLVKAPKVDKATKAKVEVKARYSDSWGGSHEIKGTLELTVKPRPSPKLGVNLLTSVIPTSKSVLELAVTNAGSVAAKNVKLTLYATGISLKKSTFGFKVVGPGQTLVLRVPCEAVSPGTYSLTAVLRYGNETKSFNYKLKAVTGPVIELRGFSAYPKKLYPGSSGVLAVTLFNGGDSEAIRLTVSVEAPGLRVSGSSITIPTLAAGRTLPMAFVFNVPPDARPGTYKVVLKVRYYFSGQKFEKEFAGTVIVYPKAQELGLSLKPEYLKLAGAVVGLITVAWLVKRAKRRKKELVIEE